MLEAPLPNTLMCSVFQSRRVHCSVTSRRKEELVRISNAYYLPHDGWLRKKIVTLFNGLFNFFVEHISAKRSGVDRSFLRLSQFRRILGKRIKIENFTVCSSRDYEQWFLLNILLWFRHEMFKYHMKFAVS